MFKSIEEFLEVHKANGHEDYKSLDLYGFKGKLKNNCLVGGRFIACTTRANGRLKGIIYEAQKDGSLLLLTDGINVNPGSVIALANSFIRYNMDSSLIGKHAHFNYKPSSQFSKPRQYKVTITHFGPRCLVWGTVEENGRIVSCKVDRVEIL